MSMERDSVRLAALQVAIGRVLDVPACLVSDLFIVNMAMAVAQQQKMINETRDTARVIALVSGGCVVFCGLVTAGLLLYVWSGQ